MYSSVFEEDEASVFFKIPANNKYKCVLSSKNNKPCKICMQHLISFSAVCYVIQNNSFPNLQTSGRIIRVDIQDKVFYIFLLPGLFESLVVLSQGGIFSGLLKHSYVFLKTNR